MDNDRGQSLITKYVWVIETIYRRRKISFKELNELWLRDDISRGVDIPKRTFDNWRYVIWDMFGINIANEGRGEYRYYIENEEDISKNGLRSWLYNTFCVSNALANSQSIKDRIILEYVPSGQDYLQPVKLKVSAGQANYIRDLKMHESQEEIERNEEYSVFTFNLRPEFDFQQELLWNGEDMEVLEPLWLRKEIAGKIKRMWNKYKEDK